VNPQLEALLSLQSQDDVIQSLEDRVAALGPRLAALDAERQQAAKAAASARSAVEREETRVRDLSGRADDFRRMNARAVAQMDMVRTAREANAATTQVDLSRRALSDAEAELGSATQRLSTLRAAAEAAEERVAMLEVEQAEARARLEAERAEIDEALAGARSERASRAKGVDPRTLMKYDRIRARRRDTAIFPLRGYSCANCDTAIPTQRRNAMGGGAIDVCESCGVLLYAPQEAGVGSH
jgi:hypothetical protein